MKLKIGLFLIIILLWPLALQAAVLKTGFPRLANYFLKWEIVPTEVPELAKWDVLILDMEVQENSRPQLLQIRQLNPKIIILAYLTSQEIIADIDDYPKAFLRQELSRQIIDGWWLRDTSGQKVSFWPGTTMLNLSEAAPLDFHGYRFNDYLPEFIATKIQASGLWDGVFFDNTWGDVAWVNGGNLDLNNDGILETPAEINSLWKDGFKKMLDKTRSLVGPEFIIIGNGRVDDDYQPILNGMMLENFPSAWENGGTWSGSMDTYRRLLSFNREPQLTIINTYDKNQENYRHFRYGLASALLGNGFYSFDYDVTSHGQTWWYDEYDVNLGPAQSGAFNLLATSAPDFKPGLWRRDFKNGLVLVNSTSQDQTYIFLKESLEKIKGRQDPLFNTGEAINYLKLAPQDGIILLKRNTEIQDNFFTNGYFFRVFDITGVQLKNGFFSYRSAFPGETEIITPKNGEAEVNLAASEGQVSLSKNGQRLASFKPYGKTFKGAVNISALLNDGYITQVVTGPKSGGPQVRVFTPSGALKTDFFAYDKKFRGGVNVALGDVDGDGQMEIITGAGQGGGPQVRIFSASGQVETSFFAYDPSFHGGIRVTTSDLNDDGRAEILAGIKNFY